MAKRKTGKAETMSRRNGLSMEDEPSNRVGVPIESLQNNGANDGYSTITERMADIREVLESGSKDTIANKRDGDGCESKDTMSDIRDILESESKDTKVNNREVIESEPKDTTNEESESSQTVKAAKLSKEAKHSISSNGTKPIDSSKTCHLGNGSKTSNLGKAFKTSNLGEASKPDKVSKSTKTSNLVKSTNPVKSLKPSKLSQSSEPSNPPKPSNTGKHSKPTKPSKSTRTFMDTPKIGKGCSSRKSPRLVSLFSGCGGMDLGFENAGFKRVWANDFDKDAQAVFERNLGKIDKRDIREVPTEEIPDCDILTAGFPCQPFSNAGNRRGVLDSRGRLYEECLRIIRARKPAVFVFENVKGLMSSKYVDGRRLVDVIVADVEEAGYYTVHKVLNASDYGVPQNRQRLFIVGVRKDLGIAFDFPEPLGKKGAELKHVLDVPKDAMNHVDWKLSPQAMAMIKFIPEGGSWKNVPYEHLAPRFKRIRDDMKKYHSPNFYRRFARDEINGTITASAQPENCGIIHPTENRRFTIREVARIQSFPDSFVFDDSNLRKITAMYKVIGNAVPVKLAECLARAIKEQVFSSKGKK